MLPSHKGLEIRDLSTIVREYLFIEMIATVYLSIADMTQKGFIKISREVSQDSLWKHHFLYFHSQWEICYDHIKNDSEIPKVHLKLDVV